MLCHGLYDLVLRFPLHAQMMLQQNSFAAQQIANGVRGLRSLRKPVMDAFNLELDLRGLCKWIVAAEIFDESAVTRLSRVGCDEPPDRELFPAQSTQTEFN